MTFPLLFTWVSFTAVFDLLPVFVSLSGSSKTRKAKSLRKTSLNIENHVLRLKTNKIFKASLYNSTFVVHFYFVCSGRKLWTAFLNSKSQLFRDDKTCKDFCNNKYCDSNLSSEKYFDSLLTLKSTFLGKIFICLRCTKLHLERFSWFTSKRCLISCGVTLSLWKCLIACKNIFLTYLNNLNRSKHCVQIKKEDFNWKTTLFCVCCHKAA